MARLESLLASLTTNGGVIDALLAIIASQEEGNGASWTSLATFRSLGGTSRPSVGTLYWSWVGRPRHQDRGARISGLLRPSSREAGEQSGGALHNLSFVTYCWMSTLVPARGGVSSAGARSSSSEKASTTAPSTCNRRRPVPTGTAARRSFTCAAPGPRPRLPPRAAVVFAPASVALFVLPALSSRRSGTSTSAARDRRRHLLRRVDVVLHEDHVLVRDVATMMRRRLPTPGGLASASSSSRCWRRASIDPRFVVPLRRFLCRLDVATEATITSLRSS